MWLKWLDPGEGDCVRVFTFDFSKAFDSVNHFILFNKLKELPSVPTLLIGLLIFYLIDNKE